MKKLILIFFVIAFSSFNIVFAGPLTYEKLGNEFTSTTGSYATSAHCTSGVGQTCSWISGNQIIIGAYDANPSTWAGSATWTFDLSGVDLQNLKSAELLISWPANFYKGLHSTTNTGEGIVRVNNNELKRYTTNIAKCGNDYFAHACYSSLPSISIPLNQLSSSTVINIETTSRTAWDVGRVKITLQTNECDNTAASCGTYPNCVNTNNLDSCSNEVYQDYSCTNNQQIYTTDNCNDCSCACGDYGKSNEINYCSDNKDNDCDGLKDSAEPECCVNECSSGAKQCKSGATNVVQTCGNYDSDSCLEWGDAACSSGQICSNGACIASCTNECSFTWEHRCNGNYEQHCGDYDADGCLEWQKAGEEEIYCNFGCLNGGCLPNNIIIRSGKIYINNNEFLVKGVDYAPWMKTTGPEPSHKPFPKENEDVTALVTSNGKIYVTDYNKDGKIQTWEVIQYDLETMKNAGINTIRTYATGEWHDKNLNGVLDRNAVPEHDEIVQGDLPNWMVDRIVKFSEDNNMKVILGYWVQEEDFIDKDPNTQGLQLETDSNDLAVAKDTMRRVIERYTNSTAVLAWGIGNEVQLYQNHAWFTWKVDINSYLNDLYAYVRSVDTSHKPIMYAKYIGENANFNNLNADIIAPNAYTFSAQELVNKREFNSAPEGKAYLLGEFAHDIEDAQDQWDLSKQYVGGFFLEFNDVWWKGSGYLFGIVKDTREKKPERYNKLYYLYTGIIADTDTDADGYLSNSDCNDNDATKYQYLTGYVDTDNDGYGAGSSQQVCSGASLPSGYKTNTQDCNNNDAAVYPGATETCDNKDNDCDGSTDEGLTQIFGTDIGECSTGTKTCQAGAWIITTPEVTATAELCDNKDNDCDSSTDESLNKSYGNNVGECKFGILTCNLGTWTTTTPSIESSTEICDNKDNDCNGLTDNNITNIYDGINIGRCKPEIKSCIAGSWQIIQNKINPVAESCNNFDDNCDGLIDENLTQSYGTNVGECSEGIKTCNLGIWTVTTSDVNATMELCNNKDDNCDGSTDENLKQNCSNECFSGEEICSAGRWLGCTANSLPTNYKEACTVGTGECENTGIIRCDGLCDTTPKASREEVCDGKDNNCDGKTEGLNDPIICSPTKQPIITITNPESSGLTFTGSFPYFVVEGTATDNKAGTKVQVNYQSQGWKDVIVKENAVGILSWKTIISLIESKNFYSLKVRAVDTNNNIAQKTLLVRYLQCEAQETSCSDGIDNDCNGLTDCGDNACNNACNPVYSQEAYNKCARKCSEEELEVCEKECELAAHQGNYNNCKFSKEDVSLWACKAAWG